MPRPADFADAHRRHREDADLLFDDARWPNADYLYGLSAECGLKAVMKAPGMQVDSAGMPEERSHRTHVRDLWPAFGAFAWDRGGAHYVDLLPDGEPFADWSHHDRYAHRGRFARQDILPHRDAAREIGRMVGRADRDGAL